MPIDQRQPGRIRMSGMLVLIIGPSGVGKSAVLQRLRERHPEFHFPRSATTRKQRPGEDDKLYHFFSDDQFDVALKAEKFLEWAQVHGGPRYGTLLEEILPFIDKGHIVIREVDVQGFDSIRMHPLFTGDKPRYRMTSFFLLPESSEQLIAHITKRAPMDADELKRRLKSMEHEMTYAKHCTNSIISREGKLDDVVTDIERRIEEFTA